MTRLLVIGGASLDVLHLKKRTVHSAGGAGMYSAMAARRCGVRASLFGPRPEPCPDPLKPVAGRLTEWLGPVIPVQKDSFVACYCLNYWFIRRLGKIIICIINLLNSFLVK